MVVFFVLMIKNVFLSYDFVVLDVDVLEIFINFNIVYVKVKDKLGRVFVEKGNINVLNCFFIVDISVLDVDDGIYDI